MAAVCVVLLLAGCSGGTPSKPATSRTSTGPTSPGVPSTATSSSTPGSDSPGPALRVTVHALTWHLPEPVAREAVVADLRGGHRVVVAGGLVAGDVSTSSAYTLDLDSGRTTKLPDLPVPVHDVAGARAGHDELVLGGGNASEQDLVQRLDDRRGWREDPPLPQPRSDLSAVTVHGRVVVVGGYDGAAPALGSVLERSPQRGWRVLAELPVSVRYAAVVACDGAVWVFGGERDGVMVDAVQRIDPDSGAARVVGHLPHAIGHASAVVFDGHVLLVGGRTGPDRLTSAMWWFDPSRGTFTRAGALPTPLADSAVVADTGSAYLVGGETPGLSARVLRISPSR